ncbi:stimulated by retinoic acid gene 6 protein-like isoform X5 [Oscarella lobularis]|uniref:stimulated by retinoic acid gene 6 protein-like isoform X5 n=1 Tax=Oscarella lobularis TaxID=121494 RepID=UPI003313167D
MNRSNVSHSALFCSSFYGTFWQLVSFLVAGIVISSLFSFLGRRRALCLKCAKGKPALTAPVNLIDSSQNRLVVAIAFGATSSTVFSFILKGITLSGDLNPWLRALVTILLMLFIATLFAPVFACITTPHKMIGCVIGFLYTGSWLGVNLAKYALCESVLAVEFPSTTVAVLFRLPEICQVIVVGWFGYKIVKKVRSSSNADDADERIIHSIQYVKRLLNSTDNDDGESSAIRNRSKFARFLLWMYPWDPYFRFPSIFLVSNFVSVLVLWQAIVITSGNIAVLVSDFDAIKSNHSTVNESTLVKILIGSTNVYIGATITGTCVSTLLSILKILLFIRSQKRKVIAVYKGKKDFIPSEMGKLPPRIINSSTTYAGMQIAYFVWDWFATYFFVLLIAALIGLCVSWIRVDAKSFFEVLYILLAPAIVSFVIYVILRLMSKFVFLERGGKQLVMNNRRLYHNFFYFSYFYNVLLGIFTFLKRVLLAAVFGLMLIVRLDRPIYARGLETWDSGFSSFISVLILHEHHNHPCLVTFLYLLQKDEKSKRMAPLRSQELRNQDSIARLRLTESSRRVRNKWLLAYTLLKNPSLSSLRKPRNEYVHIESTSEVNNDSSSETTPLLIQKS